MSQVTMLAAALLSTRFMAMQASDVCTQRECQGVKHDHLLLQTEHASLLSRTETSLTQSSRLSSLDTVTLGKTSESKGSSTNRIANTSIVIHAPVATVWRATVTEMAEWKAWNDVFDATIDVEPAVGAKFKIESTMEGAPFENTVTPMVISKLSESEGTVCWKMNQVKPDSTHVHNYEDQGGLMAGFVNKIMGEFVYRGFEKFNRALRVKCEGASHVEGVEDASIPENAQEDALLARASAGNVKLDEASLDASTQAKSSESPGPVNRIANTSVVIHAPLSVVWQAAITDMAQWRTWNEVFDARISGAPAVGVTFKIKSYMKGAPFPKTTTPMIMSKLSEAEGIACWRMNQPGMLPAMLWAEHCLMFSEAGDNSTFVHNYEDEGGSLAGFVGKLMGGAVSEGFEDFNNALRAKIEDQKEPAEATTHGVSVEDDAP